MKNRKKTLLYQFGLKDEIKNNYTFLKWLIKEIRNHKTKD